MKRTLAYFPLFAALALALASCRQEPLPGVDGLIRFSVQSPAVSSAPTKATDLSGIEVTPPGDYLQTDGNTVPVWGSYRIGGGAEANVFGDKAYLDLNCSGNGSAANWNYDEGRYYWNKSASYKFRSVFAPGVSCSGSADQVTVTYGGWPGDYDLMVAGTAVPSGDSQAANLRFLHACSAVRFFCVDPFGAGSYAISSFELKNVSKAGTLTYTGESSGTTAVAGWTPDAKTSSAYSWTAASEAAWKQVPGVSGATETSAALTDWIYLVPQALPDDATVHFTLRSGTQTTEMEHSLKPSGLPTVWEPGMIYTYFILIQPTVGFEFTVQPRNDQVVGTHVFY